MHFYAKSSVEQEGSSVVAAVPVSVCAMRACVTGLCTERLVPAMALGKNGFPNQGELDVFGRYIWVCGSPLYARLRLKPHEKRAIPVIFLNFTTEPLRASWNQNSK